MVNLAERQYGLGGSDAGPACGVSRWKSRLELYLEKRGEKPDIDEQSEPQYWGNAFESQIVERFVSQSGKKVRRSSCLFSRDHNWMFFNPDRIIVGDPRGPGILEVKFLDTRYQIDTLDDLRDEYILQIHHGFAVTAYKWGAFAILLGNRKFLILEVEPDYDLMASMLEQESIFWNEHVLKGVPPEPDGSESCSKIIKALHPKDGGYSIELNSDDAQLSYTRLKEIKAQKDELINEERTLENWFKWRMADAASAQIANLGTLSHKSTKDRKQKIVDEELLKTQFPDAYKATVKEETTPGYRRFLVQ